VIRRNEVIEPLHEAIVRGNRLRFFKSPLNDGKPDFPWHSIDDLANCMGLSSVQREFILRSMRNKPNVGDPLRTVSTSNGPVVIAPHYVAQGMIGALRQMKKVSKSAADAYARAGADACTKLIGGMSFTDGLMEWMGAAMRRWE
jgi:hypothetical protein